MVPLKDLVVFPRMVVPVLRGPAPVSCAASRRPCAWAAPCSWSRRRRPRVEEPDERDVHAVGTIARVLQMLKLPDGKIRLLVEGLERAAIAKYSETRDSFRVIVRPLPRGAGGHAPGVRPHAHRAVAVHAVQRDLQEGARRRRSPPSKARTCRTSSSTSLRETSRSSFAQKLELLSVEDTAARLERCAAIVASEIEVLCPGAGDHRQGPAQAGEDAEGLLPQRAAEGDPAGARRRGGRPHRRQGAGGEGEGQGPARGGGGEVPEGAEAPGPDAAHVPGVGAPADLPGVDRRPALEGSNRRTTATSSARARSWTRTTTI